MAKQRYINTRFWDDGYITTLDPIEKLLFIYFLTNPLTEISGAYEIPLRRVAFDTGIDKDMVLKILGRFADEDKMIYRDGWILVCNFIKHQSTNPNVEKGIENAISCCPDWIKDRLCIAYESLSHLNLNKSNLNKSNDDEVSEKKRRQVLDIVEIFEFWKTALNHSSAKLTSERKKLIKARLEDGYTVDQLKSAIEGCKNSPYHMGKNDNNTVYDDLTLICRNGSKVETFIGYNTRASGGEPKISEEDAKMREGVRKSMEMFYGR